MASDRDAAVRAGIEAAYMELTNDGWLKQKDGRVAYVLRGSVTEFYRRVLALLDSPAPESVEAGPSRREQAHSRVSQSPEVGGSPSDAPESTRALPEKDSPEDAAAVLFSLGRPKMAERIRRSAPESVEPPDAWTTESEVQHLRNPDNTGWDTRAEVCRDPKNLEWPRDPEEWSVAVYFRHPPTDSTPVGEGELVVLAQKALEAAAMEGHTEGRVYTRGGEKATPGEEYDRVLDRVKGLPAVNALLAALRTSSGTPTGGAIAACERFLKETHVDDEEHYHPPQTQGGDAQSTAPTNTTRTTEASNSAPLAKAEGAEGGET